MFSSIRMKLRIVGDSEVSQYLVNLVGSEISGQGDFFHLRFNGSNYLEREVASLSSLEFTMALKDVIKLQIPEVLLDLVYLFRPDEAVRAFRLPTERISALREKLYRTYHTPVAVIPTEGLLLGSGEHPSIRERLPIFVTNQDRKRHMYVVGKTGTGKSFMLLNMLSQDIKAGRGLCLIDPHGDLIEAVFSHIPDERKEDVCIFDPSDPEYIPGLNFLELTSGAPEEEKDQIVQELSSILLRSVDYDLAMYGPIAQQWTRYGCLTLMSSAGGGTLVEVPRLFYDQAFRQRVLKEVADPVLLYWWEKEFSKMSDFHKSEMMGYFTSKFEPLISGPQVRNVIGQLRSTFSFREILDGKKILLVNLARGKIGPLRSAFLGSVILSRICGL